MIWGEPELFVSEEKTKLPKLPLVLVFLKLKRLEIIVTDIFENNDKQMSVVEFD